MILSSQLLKEKKKFPTKNKYFCSRSCANSKPASEERKEKLRKEKYIYRKCVFCKTDFKSNRRSQRKYCSETCKYNKRLEERLNRDADEDLNLKQYRRKCKFTFNLKDFENEFDFSLIQEHGWYSPSNKGNNLKGVSRDHMVSVKYGYENNIDPAIISHPANCQLLVHSKNISKNFRNSLTVEELKERIKIWEEKYNSKKSADK